MIKALQCPFLSRLQVGEVGQQASELLKLADLCPVMGHVISYASAASEVTGNAMNLSEGNITASQTYVLTRTHSLTRTTF